MTVDQITGDEAHQLSGTRESHARATQLINIQTSKNHLLVGVAKDEALRVIFFCLQLHSSISMDTGKDVALLADLFQINKGTDAAQ